jgi:hypothetical protein
MKTTIVRGTACAIAAALPATALAALGGVVDTAPVNQTGARIAARASIARSAYSVHESATPAGTIVREYASPDGKVFAVSWNGPVKPDVRRLLGDYFETYTAAVHERRGTLRRATVERNGLVVRSSGHIRAFNGLAYLPGALPAGVTPEELQ